MEKKKLNTGVKNVVELMVKSEKGFAGLYYKYSLLFENKLFWENLAKEEIEHAQWLNALLESRDLVLVDVNIVTPNFIKVMNLALREEIESKKDISLKEALIKSLHLEKTFLENSYFEIFHGSGREFEKVIERLVSETKKHYKAIGAEMAKLA